MTTAEELKLCFHLVDLAGQVKVLWPLIQGWPQERILAWLATQGELVMLRSALFKSVLYCFRSRAGLTASFRFDAEGQLIVFP